MEFDFVNLVAIISAIISVVVISVMLRDVFSQKRKNIKKNMVQNESSKEDERYKRILMATNWLEHEREKNCGNHHADEEVYLNRAMVIREKTQFFSYVNEIWQTEKN